MASLLNTSNSNHLLYTYPPLEIAVLGGLRTDILDRMKVTLKVQVEHLSIRHTLDLYNHHQSEKFVRMVAGKLEVGTSVIGAGLDQLTDLLEGYRLEEREKQLAIHEEKEKKLLSPAEINEAQHEWKAPNLTERIGDYLEATGIVGERTNALILWYAMSSRLLPDPLSVICLAKSGTGKSYLQEKVAVLQQWPQASGTI